VFKDGDSFDRTLSMKKSTASLLILLLLVLRAHAGYLVQPNDVVGIGGDSITEQHIYSAFMEEYLLMCQPTPGQKIVQFGWSGETAPGFRGRLKTDVFPFKPTVMTTSYGMNDGHYAPMTAATGDPYRQAQTDIVEQLKQNGVRVVVIGSAKCVDSYTFHRPAATRSPADAVMYNKTLGALGDIDKEVAAKEGAVYADVFGITLDAMKKAKAKFGQDYEFGGPDGVHPGPNGALVMAYAYLKALGCDGNIGTITVDAAANQAQGTAGQEIVSCQDGTVTIKSTRYPFCFSGAADSKDPKSTAAVLSCFPFNEDLNRYTLVVKGLKSAKAKVTWGATSKVFTAADLQKGVNLAAEFLDNPFVAQFNQVSDAVHTQQDQETVLSKEIMHNAPHWGSSLAPGAPALFDQLIAAGMARHDELFNQAAALVVPIQHTIKIEPAS
jgi:lysophospholipase L1-like esterase